MLRNALLALTALTVVGCGGAVAVNQSSKPAEQKGAFFSTAEDLKVTSTEAVKGESKVVIPVFRVGFATSGKVKSHAGAGLLGNHGTANVSAKSELIGLNDETFQKITDQAYANFVKDLKAAGFEVVPNSALAESAVYQGLDKTPSPKQAESSMHGNIRYFAPTGMQLVMFPGESGGLGNFGGGFTSAGFNLAMPKLMKEQNASLITATYYVDYVNGGKTSGGMLATRASVEIGPGLSVRPGSNVKFYGLKASECKGYCPNTVADVSLGQAVYSTDQFGEFTETTSDKGAQAALNVATSLLTGSVRSWSSYEMKADPKKYAAITTDLLNKTTDKFTDTLKASR